MEQIKLNCMIVIKYSSKKHKDIIKALAHALQQGKTVVYSTDTCYGLACDATNKKALERIYKIKTRGFNKPIHIVIPSLAYAKKIVEWNRPALALAKKFWPGAITLVLPVAAKAVYLKRLGAGTGTVGLRMPDNLIALDLAAELGVPITATSANRSGGSDGYSIRDVIAQFKEQNYKPDIVLDAGRLPNRQPSTVVRVSDDLIKILRPGPITIRQIQQILGSSAVRIIE